MNRVKSFDGQQAWRDSCQAKVGDSWHSLKYLACLLEPEDLYFEWTKGLSSKMYIYKKDYLMFSFA